jgi:hypothetical protein
MIKIKNIFTAILSTFILVGVAGATTIVSPTNLAPFAVGKISNGS